MRNIRLVAFEEFTVEDNGNIVIEASQYSPVPMRFDELEEGDAPRQGIFVQLEPGRVQRYAVTKARRNGDDEILAWELRAIDGAGPLMVVIND
jgi:hypothetical protein